MPSTNSEDSVKAQVARFMEDLEHEVEQEAGPKHDVSQSDKFVQRHGMGLIIALYAVVAAVLIAGIGALALFYHPHGA